MNTIYYSHFKPFSPFSTGGVSRGINKKQARAAIRRKKLKYVSCEFSQEIGLRRFKNEFGEVIMLYAAKP